MKKLSILIPVYNEKDTLLEILDQVENVPFSLEKEIILVDDASNDGTTDILKSLESKYKVYYHERNMGKGAGLRTAISQATGDIIIIQDADLEYNPTDYLPLIDVLIKDEADVVYGSRFMDMSRSSSYMMTNLIGNKVLTLITNLLFGAKLTDMETCYKAFKSEFIKNVEIKSNRFDFEPEITAKVLKQKVRIKEVPISYQGRMFDEGKKITWKDGVHAIKALIKFRFVD